MWLVQLTKSVCFSLKQILIKIMVNSGNVAFTEKDNTQNKY